MIKMLLGRDICKVSGGAHCNKTDVGGSGVWVSTQFQILLDPLENNNPALFIGCNYKPQDILDIGKGVPTGGTWKIYSNDPGYLGMMMCTDGYDICSYKLL